MPSNYEVVLYIGKRTLKNTNFDTFVEATEYLFATMGTFMESSHFISNTESSFCISVFDVGSDKFIQLLGQIGDSEKMSIEEAFKNTGNKWK